MVISAAIQEGDREIDRVTRCNQAGCAIARLIGISGRTRLTVCAECKKRASAYRTAAVNSLKTRREEETATIKQYFKMMTFCDFEKVSAQLHNVCRGNQEVFC